MNRKITREYAARRLEFIRAKLKEYENASVERWYWEREEKAMIRVLRGAAVQTVAS